MPKLKILPSLNNGWYNKINEVVGHQPKRAQKGSQDGLKRLQNDHTK